MGSISWYDIGLQAYTRSNWVTLALGYTSDGQMKGDDIFQ